MSQNSASIFLEELREKRLKWVEANRENEFEAGIANLLTELYPDQAHFIYELLQNAEDAGATQVHFELYVDRLIVAHNGKRLFEPRDVDSITSIGRSTKKDDVNQIGKFGVGFKAVFSYTSTPRVYSGNFNFEIRDLVCPYPVPRAELQADQTKFEFPFNNPQKPAKACFEQIRVVLEGLADNVLLFLTSVEEVTWSVGTNKGTIVRLDHDHNILEIEYKSSRLEQALSSYYLKYEKKVYVEDSKTESAVAIAFKLAFKDKEQKYYSYKLGLNQQMRIVPADGQLSIFFPADKETTNLKFHSHAPFASTVARDSIPHDHMGNQKLVKGLSELLVDALVDIKEQGLLTVDCLEVLPNDEDGLSKFYKPIQKAVIQAMSTQPLVPTQGESHAPATGLLQGPADIRRTITRDRLPFFIQRSDVSWAAGVMRNSRADRLLQTLGIETWSWRELGTALDSLFKPSYSGQGPLSKSLEWLGRQDNPWIQDFYILLADLIEQPSYRFRPSPSDWHVIRTETGRHVCGSNAYFPDKQVSFDVSTLQVVSPILLEGEDERRAEKVRQFLEKAGVQEIGEREKIRNILENFYTEDKDFPPDEEHLQHMENFIGFYIKNQRSRELSMPDLFGSYHIFVDGNNEYFAQPRDCYLDTPLLSTGLSALYDGSDTEKYRLWSEYHGFGQFADFAKAVGVVYELSIERTSVRNNPNVDLLRKDYYRSGVRETGNLIDEDYTIQNLRQLLEKRDSGVSKLIWTTVCGAGAHVLEAKYKPNNSYNLRSAPSQLVHILREHVWIPDRSGKFYKPSDVSREMLPDNFPYNNHNGWLTAIGFGERARQQTEAYRLEQRVLKEAGIPSEVLEMFSGLTEEEAKQKAREFQEFEQLRKRPVEQADNKASTDSSETGSSDVPTPNFGEAFRQAFSRPGINAGEPEYIDAIPSGNFDRRRARTAEELREGIAKEPLAVERFRQVPRKVWESKNNGARTQLREAYGGKCQICGDSFQKRDGERYFEGIYIVSLTKARWIDRWGNLLCLCSKHSAMFEHGSVVADDIQEQVNACDLGNDTPMLEVELCGEEVQIQFARKHMLDLQEMMKVSTDE